MRSVAVLMVAVTMAGGAWAQDVRQMVAPRVEGITVDGVLDEAAWAEAPVSEPFRYTGTRTEAAIQTRARVGFDGDALYLGIECDEPSIAEVRSRPRERDADETWQDDCVEVFVTPELGGTRYYHFIANVDGAQYDARHGDAALVTAWDPEPDWRVATQRGAERWTAEIAIPFAALGVETPLRGELWGLKVARSLWDRGANRTADRFSAWAFTPDGYHDPGGWGRLYFESTNLIADPAFAAPAGANGLPAGWSEALNWGEGQADTGSVRREERDGAGVLHLHKNADATGSLLPRAIISVPVRGGHRYRITAEIEAAGTVLVALSIWTPEGASWVPTPARLTGEGYETARAEVDVPSAATAAKVMLSFDREPTGEMYVRRVEVTDLGVPAQAPEADIIHGLTTAAASIVEMKPYDRLEDDEGRYQFERLIFTDTGTGAEIRRISWDRHIANITYSNMYPWNPDGSAFKFDCWERPGPLYFITEPSGASFRPLGLEMPSQAPRWGREPDWLYYGSRDALMRINWRTGEREEIFRIPDEIRQGGRPSFTWNLDVPGIVYYEQAFGPGAPLYFIDLNTGGYTRIPITTDSTGDPADDWLYSASLTNLRGQWWVGYSLNHLPHLSDQHPYQQRLSSLDGTVGLNRLALEQPEGQGAQPLYSHGGRSPDGRLETGFYGGGIALWDYEAWEGRMLVPGPPGGHISWEYLDDWFFAGIGGAPLSGPFSSQLLKVYTDGTWYRVAYGNTANTAYSSYLFANISPDGTKGAYMSSMLGPICAYWCVIAYPEPPGELRAQSVGDRVTLTWSRPERAAELAGYGVYRSATSGVGYERVNAELATGESFIDTLPDAARQWHYVVTAVERSGLESRRHTGEVIAGTPDAQAPERLVVEAEAGELTAPVRENLHGSASNALFVDYRDGEGPGGATWSFPTRREGPHTLWLRVRFQGSGAAGSGWRLSAGGQELGSVTSGAREWEWVRTETPVNATAGGTQVRLDADAAGFAIDTLLLTDDPAFVPEGKLAIDAEPPAMPAGLALTEARGFDLAIAWEPVAEADHYQVYRGASAEFEPAQATLVGSPAVPRFMEWGLQQDQACWYRIAAVDSFGNESAPSAALAARTLPLGQAAWVQVEAEAGTTSLPMVAVDEAAASGGRFVKLEAQGEGEAQTFPTLDVEFEVPVAGEYVAWLRLCPVSDRGYAYLNVAVDGGPKSDMLCRFPEGVGTGFSEANLWSYAYNMRVTLPTLLRLEPGRHTLTISESHLQEFGIDEIVITNDLGRRPEGRLRAWE